MSAEELISSGIRQSDLNKVQSGQVLLQKGNTALKQALQELDEFDKKANRKSRR